MGRRHRHGCNPRVPHGQAPACFARKKFLYNLKAGPAGGRLRRPSSAGSHSMAQSARVLYGTEADCRRCHSSLDREAKVVTTSSRQPTLGVMVAWLEAEPGPAKARP